MQNPFLSKALIINGLQNLTPRDAYQFCQSGITLVDVREDYMGHYKLFDVPDVFYLPASKLRESYENIPANKPLIFADATGLRSKEAVKFLVEKGFALVANLSGGIVEWEQSGLPLQVNKNERLSGSCFCQLKQREL